MSKRLGRPWRRTVAKVIRRDAGICHLCGQPGADTADHLTPRSQGGPDTLDNLKAAHHDVWPKCNRLRGDMDLADWFATQRTTSTEGGWDW